MAELKTKPNDGSVEAFLNSIAEPKKRQDSFAILDLMKKVTGKEPVMWGESIVGFGNIHYRYSSGREGDWFLTGFSPRAQSLTVYIMSGFDRYDELMGKLGKYKTGKACLYIKKIEDIDPAVLSELVRLSAEHVARTNP